MLQINLKNKAVTQTSESFTSMCRFNGAHLGVSNSGIFIICGKTDNGSGISAMIKSGVFNLKTERKKGARFFYFELETDGPLLLTIHCDGIEAANYQVKGASGIQKIRVPISRRVRGTMWQWKVSNVDGAFFALYEVKILPIIIR